jgi:hypothetical protein
MDQLMVNLSQALGTQLPLEDEPDTFFAMEGDEFEGVFGDTEDEEEEEDEEDDDEDEDDGEL